MPTRGNQLSDISLAIGALQANMTNAEKQARAAEERANRQFEAMGERLEKLEAKIDLVAGIVDTKVEKGINKWMTSGIAGTVILAAQFLYNKYIQK